MGEAEQVGGLAFANWGAHLNFALIGQRCAVQIPDAGLITFGVKDGFPGFHVWVSLCFQ